MGYYCTVPQCTSLAGKTKNVKFHRFPRDIDLANKWNNILKRGKPFTKYSKVCSLHFTHADYNVTTMGKNKGQWKTLNKEAVPSQNLPKLHPDGTVMVIRKSRTLKYKEGGAHNLIKKSNDSIASDKVTSWEMQQSTMPSQINETDVELPYRLHNMITSPPQPQQQAPILTNKPRKQDAIMQTDPVDDDEVATTPSESGQSYNSEVEHYPLANEPEHSYGIPKDYTKPNDYVPRTNEEYNKEAEKYALERKPNYESTLPDYQKTLPDFSKRTDYQKLPEMYQKDEFPHYEASGYEKNEFPDVRQDAFVQYQNGYVDDASNILRQQSNIQMLQQQHRVNGDDSQSVFNENRIKQEIDLSGDDDKFNNLNLSYCRPKDLVSYSYGDQRHLLESKDHFFDVQVKTEPGLTPGCDNGIQPQGSPYYQNTQHNDSTGYYGNGNSSELCRPGPELLIAKQNALAAHTQLWQNTMKRPFFYGDGSHYNSSQLLHTRYEFQDLTRILNQ